jgi:hypothetical protein
MLFRSSAHICEMMPGAMNLKKLNLSAALPKIAR